MLRAPWFWLGALVGAGLWSLAVAVGPPGIAIESSFLERAHYELALLGALLGGAGGMAHLVDVEALLGPATTRGRTSARLGTLLAASTTGCLALALPPLAMHSPAAPAELGIAATLGILHVSSLGLALHTLPSSAPMIRSLLLLGAAWLLPGLLGGWGGSLQGLARPLEISRTFQLHGQPLGPQLGASLASILLWLLVAALVELRRSMPRLHALRNPG